MIVHIVMFKFEEENKASNIAKVKADLEDLVNKIDVLKSMEVGIDFNQSPRAMDMSLYSTFENEEDLKAYATHQAHLDVLAIIREVTLESKVVDYKL